MGKAPALYRKRYLPEELVHLRDDVILKHTNELIVTKWDTLKPRCDIKRGISAYFLKEGYKVSKIYDRNDHLVYWYCDIIDTIYDPLEDSYVFHDLLADILVYPDGFVKVVDLVELGDLLEKGSITNSMCIKALRNTDRLLSIIYSGNFSQLQKEIEALEN